MNRDIIESVMIALDLPEEIAAALTARAVKQSLPSNSVVYYQDDPATQLHILMHGNVRLTYIDENGNVTLLGIVSRDMTFGESGLLEGGVHCDTAFAVGPTEVLSIDLSQIPRDAPHAPEFYTALARIVAKRYRSHLNFTRGLYLPSLARRLSHALLWLLEELGNEIQYHGNKVECLGPFVTQRDLGYVARGTRENVNKTLKTWEREGWIKLEDRHILVLNKVVLQDLAGGA